MHRFKHVLPLQGGLYNRFVPGYFYRKKVEYKRHKKSIEKIIKAKGE